MVDGERTKVQEISAGHVLVVGIKKKKKSQGERSKISKREYVVGRLSGMGSTM